jgi:DnaJ homolog subfamily C member 19
MKIFVYALIFAVLFWAWKNLGSSGQTMTASEAAKLLDVPIESSADIINAAHRRLIAKVHPDAGGSAELAARVNMARDVLLRRITR